MIRRENSGMNFWKETYMGQGSFCELQNVLAAGSALHFSILPSFPFFGAYAFSFFACATLPPFFCLPKRKEQRKAQPILMLNNSLLSISLPKSASGT